MRFKQKLLCFTNKHAIFSIYMVFIKRKENEYPCVRVGIGDPDLRDFCAAN